MEKIIAVVVSDLDTSVARLFSSRGSLPHRMVDPNLT
ncbi:unnamed protein product [Amoebophrya sp. A25]|nr:unnamed protein product [Amoebophrya sp. A25]|eukprot:GSA25T00024946001.1